MHFQLQVVGKVTKYIHTYSNLLPKFPTISNNEGELKKPLCCAAL